jgi:hypothetical protein
MATVNVGTSATIMASPDTGTFGVPVTLSICQTNQMTRVCLAPPTTSVATVINAMRAHVRRLRRAYRHGSGQPSAEPGLSALQERGRCYPRVDARGRHDPMRGRCAMWPEGDGERAKRLGETCSKIRVRSPAGGLGVRAPGGR